MLKIILVHSPLVGPNSLAPTAEALRELGLQCLVPSPMTAGLDIPSWRDWPDTLLGQVPSTGPSVVVGHSMGGLLAARLAGQLGAAGMICLDASIPPETGETPTVEPAFHDFVKGLPNQDGLLPPWHEWWPVDVFAGAEISSQMRARVLSDIPRLRLDWFDDTFDMPNWSGAKRAYLRTSPAFIDEAKKADALGWDVAKLRGTHMHPATEPQETADAIVSCCQRMGIL